MPSWSQVEAEAPELTALARGFFDAHVHKTIATLRRDGSPRISGTEVEFRDGEIFFGSMWMAMKARDLLRDPRFALHSGSDDPPGWNGDAKVGGRAVEVDRPEGPPHGRYHLFRADITELAVVRLDAERKHLVIESWHEGRGVSRIVR
jgi:hypothetical protein